MLRNMQVDHLIADLADGFKRQADYVLDESTLGGEEYKIAVQTSIVEVVGTLHKHVVDFDVDAFYKRSGYIDLKAK